MGSKSEPESVRIHQSTNEDKTKTAWVCGPWPKRIQISKNLLKSSEHSYYLSIEGGDRRVSFNMGNGNAVYRGMFSDMGAWWEGDLEYQSYQQMPEVQRRRAMDYSFRSC